MLVSDKHANRCRAVLAASGASLMLFFSSSSAQAVNLNEAKRRCDCARLLPARDACGPPHGTREIDRSAERKLEVQKAAQEAAESGVAVETSLTSDKTVPESVQRGRNSRTGPLSNKE